MRILGQIDSLKAMVAATVVAVAALLVGLPLIAAQVDAQAGAYEKDITQAALKKAVGEVEYQTGMLTNWDAMLAHTDNTPDPAWLEENARTNELTHFTSSVNDVVDWQGRLIFASEHARPMPPERSAAFAEALAPLVAEVRRREAAALASGGRSGARARVERINVSAMGVVQGRVYLLFAGLIGPDTGTVTQRRPLAPVMANAADFGAAMLPDLTRLLRLRDVTLVAGPPHGGRQALALRDLQGRVVANLAWTARTPGRDLLVAAALPILLVVGALAAGVAFAYRRGSRSALALVASEARANHLAFHDQLTELANRRLLTERLTQALAACERRGGELAVLLIDLDRFKFINDTYGHQCGDELLREVAARLTQTCRAQDVCARLGGDEFVVLAIDCGPAEAAALAERLLARLKEPIHLSAATVHTAGSIGVAVHRAAAGEGRGETDDLMRQADLALYRVKEHGRGAYCFFEVEMDQALQSRRGLEADLRQALRERALEVVYQPQFDGDVVVGLEALARWTHPERGPVAPSFFIPLAEECGLIEELGLQVARRVFEDSWRWPRLRLAINLSAAQLRMKSFLSRLQVLVEETGVDPERFEFELTEGVLMADDLETQHTLAALRGLGFGLALGDFGAGYSSLSYLRRFPIDKIKIDRAFVAGLPQDKVSESVIRAIVRLGRALSLEVVAEGVETEEQRRRLQAAGCRTLQGYLTGRPMPADDVRALLSGGAAPVNRAEAA